jgi:large subunit ribosomal protein L2
MGLKTYNPTSPGRRQLITTDRSELWKGAPVKGLTEGLSSKGGRNNTGRITAYHRGGGHKRSYRTAWIALIKYEDGELAYIIAPQRLSAGDKVVSTLNSADVKPGNAMPLERMPVGTIVHNVEMKPRKGGQIARSAGTYAQYVGRDAGWAILRLNSGEQRRVHGSCLATVGSVSNQDHSNTSIGKAGRNRWLGRKPVNRGVTMNPVDHPHGGGEGRTSGGRHPVTPWGKPTKGKKTRTNKSTDKFIVRSRHVKKGR